MCQPCDHNVNFEKQEEERRARERETKNQRQRDELTEGKEQAARESKDERARKRKGERGQIYQTNSRSHIKEIGTSETAGALGNNALLSFSFTSGPKRT